jgi:hypothetical protein
VIGEDVSETAKGPGQPLRIALLAAPMVPVPPVPRPAETSSARRPGRDRSPRGLRPVSADIPPTSREPLPDPRVGLVPVPGIVAIECASDGLDLPLGNDCVGELLGHEPTVPQTIPQAGALRVVGEPAVCSSHTRECRQSRVTCLVAGAAPRVAISFQAASSPSELGGCVPLEQPADQASGSDLPVDLWPRHDTRRGRSSQQRGLSGNARATVRGNSRGVAVERQP